MKEYKVICINNYAHTVIGGFDDTGRRHLTLEETIEKLTIEINRYLNNGAILNGGVSITMEGDHYVVSQAITIIKYLPPDGNEEY
jgi:hypothetical protein